MVENRFIRTWIPLVLSGVIYLLIGYNFAREDTYQLVACFAIVVFLYIWLVLKCDNDDYNVLFSSAIVLRLLLIASIPTLSDDIYRFIWLIS